MAKTKKNVQKKRRQLRKKTRGGGGGTYASREAAHKRQLEINSYRPTNYDVMLGDDNSVFSLLVEKHPNHYDYRYDLINAIRNYRKLPKSNDYPTRVLNAWKPEFKTKPDTGEMYIFVPRSMIQKNDFQTGYITFTFVESPFEPK